MNWSDFEVCNWSQAVILDGCQINSVFSIKYQFLNLAPQGKAFTKENSLNVCLPFLIWIREVLLWSDMQVKFIARIRNNYISWELSREKKWDGETHWDLSFCWKINKTFSQCISFILSPTFVGRDQNRKLGIWSLHGYNRFFPACNRFISAKILLL